MVEAGGISPKMCTLMLKLAFAGFSNLFYHARVIKISNTARSFNTMKIYIFLSTII